MNKQKFKGYNFSSEVELSNNSLNAIVALLDSEPELQESVLGGRAALRRGDIEGLGNVVIKQYKRGGILGKIIKNFYIKAGSTRPENEYQLLNNVKALGILAPQAISAVTKGSLLYQGWLVMKELPSQKSLAEISLSHEDSIEKPMQVLTSQVETLINNYIYHVDLHPGNALLDEDGRVYVLDFDKASLYYGNKNSLRDKYVCRWRRAVIKHNLPETLSELMCIGLRKNFDIDKECSL